VQFRTLPIPERANLSLTTTATTSGACSDSDPTGTGDIDTTVADLSLHSLSINWVVTQEQYDELVRTISKPRHNLGGNGPPGRTD
jgi:hypothetical protein